MRNFIAILENAETMNLVTLLAFVEENIDTRLAHEDDGELVQIKELVAALRVDAPALTTSPLRSRLEVIEDRLTDWLLEHTDDVFEEEPEIDNARFEVQEYTQKIGRRRRNR